ncbi:MAG TPA: hypothetical protein DCZ72_00120 [Armatimonadetes bacterium]|nr:hypothetical protein [Armatimonadota bacterium]
MKTLADAIALYQQERYVDAERRLALVTQFEPENVEAWMYYGATLAKLGRWPQSVEALRQVVRLRPDQVSGYCELAAALIEADDRAGAQAVLDQAASLDPDHPNLAGLRSRLGDTSSGRTAAAAAQVEPPADRPGLINDGNRLWFMLAALGILLLLVIVPLARRGSSTVAPGSIESAEALVLQAERERESLARQPGEDFDVQGRVGQLAREAEAQAQIALGPNPRQPRAYAVLAAASRLQNNYSQALSQANEGLDLIGQPGVGGDATVMARLLLIRAQAQANLAAGPGYATALAQARADAAEAARLDPTATDPELDRLLAQRR